MSSALIVRGALANTGIQSEEDSFLETLTEVLPVYKHVPQPGIFTASLDWLALLGTTADVIAVGGLLWSAYERYIKPKRAKDPESRALLVINISDDKSHTVNFVLGDVPTEREIFIEAFSRSVTLLRHEVESDGTTVSKAIEIEESRRWVRLKRGS